MLIEDDIFREIGNIDEFERQIEINEELGLDIIGPVYRSWKPSHTIQEKVKENDNLRNISTLDLLLGAKSIIDKHKLVSVRQDHYGLVSEQTIYNNFREYRRVVRVLKRGRLAGLVSFDSVVDDTREAEKTPSWKSFEELLNAAILQYRSNWWRDQPYYVEVWLEKRALRRIFYPITNAHDVYLCTGGGYQSWSEVWEGKKRFYKKLDKELKILYFGDLDPSGKDMPRDINERFATLGVDVDIVEVALTKDDIHKHNLPRNPTKSKDTRESWYVKKYGINYAVELDALPPDVLRSKIKKAIEDYCDIDLLSKHVAEDNEKRKFWRTRINHIARARD